MTELDEIRARHETHGAWLAWFKSSQLEHGDREWLLGEVERLTRERDEARAEVERLRTALTFYADERSYKTATVHMSGHFVGQAVVIDGGEQARKALENER